MLTSVDRFVERLDLAKLIKNHPVILVIMADIDIRQGPEMLSKRFAGITIIDQYRGS
jgi:hypothetical protein